MHMPNALIERVKLAGGVEQNNFCPGKASGLFDKPRQSPTLPAARCSEHRAMSPEKTLRR
jgi:hypothetical protein